MRTRAFPQRLRIALQADIASAHREQLRSLLHGNRGIDYERRAVLRRVGDAPVATALPITAAWLRKAHASVSSSVSGAPNSGPAAARVPAYVLQGLIDIAGANKALDLATCPEVLQLDLERVHGMQNDVQGLTLRIAIQLILLQLLREQGVDVSSSEQHTAWLSSLQHRLSVVMAQPDVNFESIVAEMSSLVDKRCQLQGVQMTSEARELVSSMLRRVASAEDPIFKFVQKAVLAALSVALWGGDEAAVKQHLAPVNGQTHYAALREVAGAVKPVMSLSASVSDPVYTALVQELLLEA